MEKLKACAGPAGKRCPKKAKIRDVAHWLRCPECREVQRRVNNAALDKARYERAKAGLRAGSVDPQHRSKVDLRKARETTQGITPAVTSQSAWCRQLQQVANLCLSVLFALLLTGCENTCRPCFFYGPDRAPGFRWTTGLDAAHVQCSPCSEAKSPEALKICGGSDVPDKVVADEKLVEWKVSVLIEALWEASGNNIDVYEKWVRAAEKEKGNQFPPLKIGGHKKIALKKEHP